MTLSNDDVRRLGGRRVVDSKGEKIGRVERPHVLKGTLVGVHVRLDDVLARLPGVDRDGLEVAPRFLREDENGDVVMDVDFMDAITGHAIPRNPRTGAVVGSEAPPHQAREWMP